LTKKVFILLSLFFLLIVSFLISISVGSVAIPLEDFLHLNSPEYESARKVIMDIRLPRTLNTMLVGAGLSCSGILLQSMLNNNLAEPGLIGISAGAGLGAILTFILPISVSFFLITPVSFVFAVAATSLIYIISKGFGSKSFSHISSNKIILTGIAVSALISSINGFLMLISGSSITQIVYWLNGGFSGRGWEEFYPALVFVSIGLVISILVSKDLNVLNLGEELSVSLGMNLNKIQKILIFSASLLAASAVSVAGIISFVGLIIPNLSKLIIGNDHRFAVPCAIILGAFFLAVSDTIARTLISPVEIPVGIITSFAGAPVFIWLLLRKRRNI